MIVEEIKNEIKNLYIEKKYDELIYFSEKNTSPDERPSALINLIGISYYSKKNPSKEDYRTALSLFENAYLKEKNTVHGLNAIKNLVVLGISTSKVFDEYVEFLIRAKELLFGGSY